MRRVLITGSREWKDQDKVWIELNREYDKNGPFILVHGAAKDGVDHMAQEWYEWYCDEKDIAVEPHAADWKPSGRNGYVDRGAGIKRNHLMVELGADKCLAFPTVCHKGNCKGKPDKHYSHGTWDCMTYADKKGIDVDNFGPPLT